MVDLLYVDYPRAVRGVGTVEKSLENFCTFVFWLYLGLLRLINTHVREVCITEPLEW